MKNKTDNELVALMSEAAQELKKRMDFDRKLGELHIGIGSKVGFRTQDCEYVRVGCVYNIDRNQQCVYVDTRPHGLFTYHVALENIADVH
jgi:hypothetical protein